MNRVLVTGATGTVGREVVFQLRAKEGHVRALTRDPQASNLPSDVEVVRGDFTDPDSLDGCLEGIDTVFLVWRAPVAAASPALQRIAKHARRIVFLSAPYKTRHAFFQQPNPMAAMQAQLEQQIQESGLEWTFLRPGIFAANSRFWWAPRIRAGDSALRWPYPDVSTAPIDERDIAAVAVHALSEPGHAGADYVLTGPESLTQQEQVRTIGRVLGRDLWIEELSPEQALAELGPWMSARVTQMLLNAWGAAAGKTAYLTSTVAEITGAPTRTFFEWVTNHVLEFQEGRAERPIV